MRHIQARFMLNRSEGKVIRMELMMLDDINDRTPGWI